MKYVFGNFEPGAYACALKALQNVSDDFELFKGLSRGEDWPSDAFFPMDDSSPEDKKLEDFIFNINGLLVVSQKVKNLFSGFTLKNNEWLPVQIVDHKGRAIKEQYYILHQVYLQDCINLEKSLAIKNRINPEVFMRVMKLEIDEDRIDPELVIFRMEKYPDLPIFDRKVAEKIKNGGCTGIMFGELDDWDGI